MWRIPLEKFILLIFEISIQEASNRHLLLLLQSYPRVGKYHFQNLQVQIICQFYGFIFHFPSFKMNALPSDSKVIVLKFQYLNNSTTRRLHILWASQFNSLELLQLFFLEYLFIDLFVTVLNKLFLFSHILKNIVVISKVVRSSFAFIFYLFNA
jgi:hypothetical protein